MKNDDLLTTLRIDVQDHIATVAIDVPDRPVNLLTPALAADLAQVADALTQDADWRGLVFVSGKPGGFIAGADVQEIATRQQAGISAIEAAQWTLEMSRLFRRFETCGKPVAAALGGAALGGGFELALACHYRVVADLPTAVVGLPEVTLGLLPGAGGTQRLPRLVGLERALPLLLQGRHVGPAEAVALGLVHAKVATGTELAAARAWVAEAIARGTEVRQPWDQPGFRLPDSVASSQQIFGAGTAQLRAQTQDCYPAPQAILSAVYEGMRLGLDRALQVEARYFGQLAAGPVAKGLVRTLFLNKRRAEQGARRPVGRPPLQVTRLGVVGAGMMGAGIAFAAASAGIDVVLVDTTHARALQASRHAERVHAKAVAGGAVSVETVAALVARIQPSDDIAALAGCQLVVEAVFEDTALKHQVLARIAAVVGPQVTIASNTSTLQISGLARGLEVPERLIGGHFFSPVERMPLLEIILGRGTGERALADLLDLARQLRKTPIVVHDGPGFFTSRVFCAYIDEGMALLAEGVAPALIENAARHMGLPIGPLAVTDEVSLDLQQRVVDQGIADAVPARQQRRHAQPVIAEMNARGRLGRKSGAGFYDMPAGAPKRLWPGLQQVFPPRAQQPHAVQVGQRLLYAQMLEAARCVEEGIVTAAEDADLAAVLGIGFPKWTGGPLSLIDSTGIAAFVEQCQALAAVCGERFAPSAWLADRARRGLGFYRDEPGSD